MLRQSCLWGVDLLVSEVDRIADVSTAVVTKVEVNTSIVLGELVAVTAEPLLHVLLSWQVCFCSVGVVEVEVVLP